MVYSRFFKFYVKIKTVLCLKLKRNRIYKNRLKIQNSQKPFSKLDISQLKFMYVMSELMDSKARGLKYLGISNLELILGLKEKNAGQKFQIRSKTPKIPIKTQDNLVLNVIVTLQSLHFTYCLFSTRKIFSASLQCGHQTSNFAKVCHLL